MLQEASLYIGRNLCCESTNLSCNHCIRKIPGCYHTSYTERYSDCNYFFCVGWARNRLKNIYLRLDLFSYILTHIYINLSTFVAFNKNTWVTYIAVVSFCFLGIPFKEVRSKHYFTLRFINRFSHLRGKNISQLIYISSAKFTPFF